MPPRRAGRGAGAGADKPPTKAQLMSQIAAETDLTKAQVESVFEVLESKMVTNLKRHGAFKIPGLLNVKLNRVAAKPARMGRKPGSTTGEMVMFAAKPAQNRVRVSALKALKDQVV